MPRFTPLETRIDAAAHRLIARAPERRAWAAIIEFLVFGAKQAWASIFGGLMLAVVLAARIWYSDDAVIARSDAITIAAVLIQIGMVVFRLETFRELRVVLLFHVVGTVMELFKTDVGSWSYDGDGVLRIAAVPLYSGFMYAAVGSYLVRVFRLFDLRFDRYPRRWVTAVIAAAIYVNFFSHHFVVDARWLLLASVALAYFRTTMHVRVLRIRFRMPVLAAFLGVATVIWLAENLATWAGAWAYPNQLDGWEPVGVSKLVSWFLLMIISVVLVTWVYPPKTPESLRARAAEHPVSDAADNLTQCQNPSPITAPSPSTAPSTALPRVTP